MKKRSLTLAGATVTTMTVSLLGIGPGLSQESSGVVAEFQIDNSFEATRNPTLTAGNDDIRSTFTTALDFSLSSETERAQLVFSAGADLRYSYGDVSATNEGFTFGGETLGLSYAYQAPRASITSSLAYSRTDLSFIAGTDLVEDQSGAVTILSDFDDLADTGTRENLSYRVSAQFDEDSVFGWGATVSGNVLNYSNVVGATLDDSVSFNALLNAHFDVAPTLRIDTGLLYAQGNTDTTDLTSTTTLNIGLTAVRSDNLSVQGQLAFAFPDSESERISLTGGVTARPTARSNFSANAGVVLSDEFDTQIVGRLSYSVQPTSTSQFDFALNSTVTDATNGGTVIDTTAIAGADFALTTLTSLSFDAVYAQQRDIATDSEVSELSASLQLNRQLTRDWQLSVGASSTTRQEDGSDSATAEALFVSFGRSWQGGLF
jgi:hypothetical protein